jgi:hypothetical protein
MIAKVLHVLATQRTSAIGPAKPRNAKPLTEFHSRDIPAQLLHAANNLVPRSDRSQQRLQLSSRDMQISPANTTGLNPKQDFARSR